MPYRMNELILLSNDTLPLLPQCVIPMNGDLDHTWSPGRIMVLSDKHLREMHDTSRTLLPCFIALKDNLQSTELGSSYTASRIFSFHLSMTELGGDLSTRFPIAIELVTTGAISEALISKRSWASPQA